MVNTRTLQFVTDTNTDHEAAIRHDGRQEMNRRASNTGGWIDVEGLLRFAAIGVVGLIGSALIAAENEGSAAPTTTVTIVVLTGFSVVRPLAQRDE